jgi:hypothetical protein
MQNERATLPWTRCMLEQWSWVTAHHFGGTMAKKKRKQNGVKFTVIESRAAAPEEVEGIAHLLASWWIREYEDRFAKGEQRTSHQDELYGCQNM